MRKEFRKFAITFVTAIVMTMILSVGAQAAVNVSSGDGSESSPYEITVSGASEELLEYQLYPDSENKYYFASRIKLKATEIVQITIKDVKDEENYFSIKREGKDNGKRAAKFIVRSGETLNVKASARSGGVSTMKITAKVVSNEEYCRMIHLVYMSFIVENAGINVDIIVNTQEKAEDTLISMS